MQEVPSSHEEAHLDYTHTSLQTDLSVVVLLKHEAFNLSCKCRLRPEITPTRDRIVRPVDTYVIQVLCWRICDHRMLRLACASLVSEPSFFLKK